MKDDLDSEEDFADLDDMEDDVEGVEEDEE